MKICGLLSKIEKRKKILNLFRITGWTRYWHTRWGVCGWTSKATEKALLSYQESENDEPAFSTFGDISTTSGFRISKAIWFGFQKTVFITFSKTIGFLAQTSDFSHEKPFVVHNHRIN